MLDLFEKNLEVFFICRVSEVIDRLFKAMPNGAIYSDHVALIVDLVIVWSVD